MPIIKNDNSRPLLKEAVVLDLSNIAQQGERLRQAAEAKAADILQEAQQQAQAIIEKAQGEGYQKGYDEGFQAGQTAGQQQGHDAAKQETKQSVDAVVSTWLDLANQWDAQRVGVERECNEAVIDFALRFAEMLTQRVLEVDRSVVVDQIGNAASLLLKPMDVSVRIHPEDREVVEDALPQLVVEFANLKHVHLIDDPSIGQGGCVLTYGQGQIDATLEKQMERIIDAILPEAVAMSEAETQEAIDASQGLVPQDQIAEQLVERPVEQTFDPSLGHTLHQAEDDNSAVDAEGEFGVSGLPMDEGAAEEMGEDEEPNDSGTPFAG